jgi:glycosyltransferase involved in cell wall biosynthesis
MKIAIIGDRGIPASYSGFSTLVEELSVQLVAKHGMDVTVYGRKRYFQSHPPEYRGVKLIWMSAPGGKSFESIIHTNRAIAHAVLRGRFDLVFLVDPGNGPFSFPLRLSRVPVVCHTDGLGWKRAKWGRLQKLYYRWAERASAALADWLVTDSRAMVAYYQSKYGATCSFIPYGAVVGRPPNAGALGRYGLEAGGYYLLVARIEPDNNPLLVIKEFKRSNSSRPLVVVGGVPFKSKYWNAVQAEADTRVRILGPIYDSGELNGLWRHSYAYLHGHEVGGTNPSLLRAMAAPTAPIVLGVEFNREVVGGDAPFFTRDSGSLASVIDRLDRDPAAVAALRDEALRRSRAEYRWDSVASGYARMFRDVVELKRGRKRREELESTQYYQPGAFGGCEDWANS